MASSTPLRRELLVSFGLLLGGAMLLAAIGLLAVAPLLRSPGEGILYVMILLVADLCILSLFLALILRSRLIHPLEGLVEDVRRIARGDLRHRVAPQGPAELEAIQESVNEMADRLIHDQERLSDNIESLDRTNRELVEVRDQVVQSARLASVGTLAAGIAHEVGNPLGAIIGYADVARRRIEREDRDPELIDAIRSEAVRIDRIVRGLLDYARGGDGEPEPTDVRTVLARVRELLQRQGRLDGVDDRWEIGGEVPPVLVEAHQLEQVAVNLALNALQAMEGTDDPRIRVSVGHEGGPVTHLPRRRQGDPPGVNYMHRRRVLDEEWHRAPDPLFTSEAVVVVRFEDSGPGVPANALDRVFDPFFTTKEPGEGTGLGLSICARLVEGMGGKIEASNDSVLGGAAFTVRLPGTSMATTGTGATPSQESTP